MHFLKKPDLEQGAASINMDEILVELLMNMNEDDIGGGICIFCWMI